MTELLLPYTDPRFRRQLFAALAPWTAAAGLRVVLADDDIGPEDRRLFAGCVELPPPVHVDEAFEVLLRHVERHPVDAVLAESEAALLPGALLCRRLGLSGPSPTAALLATDKWLQRQALAAAGVPVPRFALASDAGDVRRFAAVHGYPLMLKAVASTLSRNVLKVSHAAEVEPAVAALLARLPSAPDVRRCAAFARLAAVDPGCDPHCQFLVEEFCDGDPVEVDGLYLGSEPWSFGVTDQLLSTGPVFFIEGYLFPADRPAAEIALLERTALAAARALQLSGTAFSIELRTSAGRCVVIEVNGRLGQDDGFPELFHRGLGSFPLQLWLEALASGRPPVPRPARGHHALAYVNHYSGGRVTCSAAGRPDARERAASFARQAADPRALAASLVVPEGAQLAGLGAPDFDPHVAAALASHATSSAAAYAAARAALQALAVTVEPPVSA